MEQDPQGSGPTLLINNTFGSKYTLANSGSLSTSLDAKKSGALSCLQARLLQHERNSGQLSTAQEAMARKCDELHRGMAAKQADCAAALARCGQQQEQINSLRSLLAASQVGEEGNGVELAVRHPI